MPIRFVRSFVAPALASFLVAAAPAHAGVGVSVGVDQPGFYGRIDIGAYPAPAVIYPQPVVIAPSPVAVVQRPIYLVVPPDHRQHWTRYCREYRACDQPVYFVPESWVREHRDHDHDRGHGHGKGHRKHGDD